MVVFDEAPQLAGELFDHVIKTWLCSWPRPKLVVAGDGHQLPALGVRGGATVEVAGAMDSVAWKRYVEVMRLTGAHRVKDVGLQRILDVVRAGFPDPATLGRLTANRLFGRGEPTPADVERVLREHPDTMVLTVKKEGARQLNAWIRDILFPGAPLGWIRGDPDGLPGEHEFPAHKGMRMQLTENFAKDRDGVNGMPVTLCSLSEAGVLVRADTGRYIMVHRISRRQSDGRWDVFLPLREGYAL